MSELGKKILHGKPWVTQYGVLAVVLVSACFSYAQGLVDLSRWYAHPSAGWLFFEGGQPASSGVQTGVAIGHEVSEFWSLEVGGMWAPWLETEHPARANGRSLYGGFADALYHVNSYERFDPYVALGVGVYRSEDAVLGGGDRDVLAGPRAGVGFLYNVTDRLALKADARAFMAADSTCETLYSITAGIVYRFGGTGLTAETWEVKKP
jgi:opacity protein-like surface antigen